MSLLSLAGSNMSNTVFDGVIKSEFLSHIDEIAHKQTQPTEDLILARNAELRKNPGALHDLGAQSGDPWGRMVATIPMNMFEAAIRNGYDLNNRDSSISGLELARYLRSEEGKKCLVQAPKRGVH
jgi:hypothetical protein